MEYKVKDLGSYKLHLIKNSDFKTIRVKVFFNEPIKKDKITIRNFLASLLVLSNEKYKTKRQVALKCQDLYSCGIGYNICRFGNYSNLSFSMDVLEDKYTEEGNFKQALEFFSDIIFKPNVVENAFDETYFNIVKNDARVALNSLKEDKGRYSTIRMLEAMDKNSPLSFRTSGYVEDLDNITKESLYEYYKEMLDNDIVDIFVIGNIDFDEIEKLIRLYFPVKVYKKITLDCRLEEKKSNIKRVVQREEDDSNQSKLAIGCRCFGLSDYERSYPLTIYNIILGGGTNSKLFKEVREENSYCYYINSVPNKLDNLLIIRAGISRVNFESVVRMIEDQMIMIRRGKFTDFDMEEAKKMYVSAIDEIKESQNDIIDSYYMMELLGVDDLETKKKKMLEVTRDEIIAVSKKIKIDTIYLLEGVKE